MDKIFMSVDEKKAVFKDTCSLETLQRIIDLPVTQSNYMQFRERYSLNDCSLLTTAIANFGDLDTDCFLFSIKALEYDISLDVIREVLEANIPCEILRKSLSFLKNCNYHSVDVFQYTLEGNPYTVNEYLRTKFSIEFLKESFFTYGTRNDVYCSALKGLMSWVDLDCIKSFCNAEMNRSFVPVTSTVECFGHGDFREVPKYNGSFGEVNTRLDWVFWASLEGHDLDKISLIYKKLEPFGKEYATLLVNSGLTESQIYPLVFASNRKLVTTLLEKGVSIDLIMLLQGIKSSLAHYITDKINSGFSEQLMINILRRLRSTDDDYVRRVIVCLENVQNDSTFSKFTQDEIVEGVLYVANREFINSSITPPSIEQCRTF